MRSSASAGLSGSTTGGLTLMSQAAQNLSAGNWVELPVPANMVSALTQYGELTQDYIGAIGYCNEATWDDVGKKINIIGKRGSTYPMRQHQYRAPEHDWIVQNPDLRPTIHEWGHGYDYNIRNSFTGRLYFKRHPSGELSNRIVYYADPPDYVWSLDNKLPLWPATGGRDIEAQPAFFWEGRMLGIGSQGAVVLCVQNGSGSASFVIYNVQGGAWRSNVDITPPVGKTISTFEKWGSYSAVYNCGVAILIDSDANPRAYRLNANATVTELTAPLYGAGAHSGGIHAGLFTCDPVSGKFLLLNTGGTFWELDPTGSGTWTQLTGNRTPPAGIVNYGDKNPVAVPIPEYGVVCFFSLSYVTNVPHMYLYKHGPDTSGGGEALLVDKITGLANLRFHPGSLWCPQMDTWEHVKADWGVYHNKRQFTATPRTVAEALFHYRAGSAAFRQ